MNAPMIDATHDRSLAPWVAGAQAHRDFPVQNLPLGIFSPRGERPRVGTAIGDKVLCLEGIADLLPVPRTLLATATLNALMAQNAATRSTLRARLSRLLCDRKWRAEVEPHLHEAADCKMYLPAAIGDYTDFYTGIHHAENIGRQLRPDNPLLPNYKWVPIGYHGRSSSVRPSGEPLVRPKGQRKPAGLERPLYEPTRRLDYEVELGVWIGQGNELGDSIPVERAQRHFAGLCILNDWSARDLQAWEYQPLGPFLSKNFHSTISPWVVTAEALAPFRTAQPERPTGDPRPLPYLWSQGDQEQGAFSIELKVFLSTKVMRDAQHPPVLLGRSRATDMYWTVAQIIAQHSSNGCNLRPGDLLGSGTISGPTPDSYGSLMEITCGGSRPVALPTGEARTFLEDGDVLSIAARAEADGYVPIGFGPCSALILPARP